MHYYTNKIPLCFHIRCKYATMVLQCTRLHQYKIRKSTNLWLQLRNMKFYSVITTVVTISKLTAVVSTDTCSSPVIASCPPSWQPWGDSCYRFTDERADWDQSKLACQAIGGMMGVPHSQEEIEFMMQMARRESITHFWIGCSDTEKEGTWVCEGQGKGEPFFNWKPGEPNNAGGNEDCVEIRLDRIGSMNDRPCNTSFSATSVCAQRQASCLSCSTEPACSSHPHPARHYCFAADTKGKLLNSCLLGHVIREFVTRKEPQCALACMKEPACCSFNIKHNNQGQQICQLNNATRCDDPAEFQDIHSSCIYGQDCAN
ncbi:P-selectin-like [Acanthaster planci]|uniref:P-selectin-like n=1 Tax=Acanthaster planci TaxID=133434 RepID=A0A8B7YBW9_ACAPL|nr:P-selectin-like [Acanthaster planci]